MADNKRDAIIKSLMDTIIKNKNSLYTDVYYNKNDLSANIDLVKDRMDDTLSKISNTNTTNTGSDNISVLYSKTLSDTDQKDRDFINNLNNVLSDKTVMDNVMAVYTQNTWVRDIDAEIDMVCKYMPKLLEALETRMEHVLSADHFQKDPILIKPADTFESKKTTMIDTNIENMIRKYDIYNLFTDWYKDMDKRGEVFIYIVPYKKALDELLKTKQANSIDGPALNISQESVEAILESNNIDIDCNMTSVIHEAAEEIEDLTKKNRKSEQEMIDEQKLLESVGDVKISLNKSGVLTSALKDCYKATKFFSENSSLFFSEDGEILSDVQKQKENFTKMDNDSLAADGMVDPSSKNNRRNKITIPGCIVKKLDHTMVKPLYIDDICLGYFYIECDKKIIMEQTTFSSTIGGIRPGNYNKPNYDPYGSYGNEYAVIKNIANKISQKIDASFINANQDLSKEIYYILKYNSMIDSSGKISKINITYIPPEDLNHEYFEFDYQMKRGVSGLFKSLFPAKLFSCLYISNVIQILTRGNDKRVYYVKQSVDTNISGVMNGVINQIQKGNFGIRQIESMSNVLNQIGRFNDFLIPRSPNGDSPIDFEVIQGQQVDVKTELMNMLEEMAVNATDVPIEVITSRQQVDYATHLTMTNTKFLQKIYNRQGITQRIFSKLITKIYNFEYQMDSPDKVSIAVELPLPIYLNSINTGQIVDSVNTLGDSVAKIEYPDEEAEKQIEFGRVLKKNMIANMLPKGLIEKCKAEAELNLAKNGNQDNQQ